VVRAKAYPGKGGEVMKEEGKDATILQKDKNYVKFHRLLAKAEAEGRLDGKFQCPVCGMKYLSSIEADECCRIISD
jgi:hypothetical protein